MAIGQRGSYGTDAPIQGNPLGDALAFVENQGFRYRQEKALADKLKRDEEEKIQKDVDENLAKFQGKATGSYTIDNVSSKLARESADRYAENARRLSSVTNPQERDKLRLENQNLLRNFDTSKQQVALYLAKQKEIEDNIQKGIYNPDDEQQLKEFAKSLESMDARIDENGIWKFSTYDKGEDGTIGKVVANDLDMAQLVSGLDRFKKSKYGDFKQDFLKNNQLSETEIQRGFTTETKKLVDDRIKNQAYNAGVALSKDNNEMYQQWLELTGERKRDWNDAERELVAKKIQEDLVKSYGETYKKDIDQSGALALRKQVKDEEKDAVKKTVTEFDDQLLRDDFIEKTMVKDNVRKNIIGVEEGKVKFKNLGGQKSGLNNGYVTAFGIDKNGDIVVTGKALKTKGAKFKMSNGNELSFDEISTQANSGNPEAQLKLDQYSKADNYGRFVRKPSGPELSSLLLQAGYEDEKQALQELKQINKEEIQNKPKSKPKVDY